MSIGCHQWNDDSCSGDTRSGERKRDQTLSSHVAATPTAPPALSPRNHNFLMPSLTVLRSPLFCSSCFDFVSFKVYQLFHSLRGRDEEGNPDHAAVHSRSHPQLMWKFHKNLVACRSHLENVSNEKLLHWQVLMSLFDVSFASLVSHSSSSASSWKPWMLRTVRWTAHSKCCPTLLWLLFV